MTNNVEQIKKVIENENDLINHIDKIYQLTDKELEIKVLYKEQIKLLKIEYRNKKLNKEQLKQKIRETKSIYQKYDKKIKDLLNLNYSISIWQYQQDNILKSEIDYHLLKQEYLNKLVGVKENKTEQKKLKQEYQNFKKNINPKYIALLATISIILLIIVSLLVNYLFYFKIANNGEKFTFNNSNHLTAFIFVCIAIVLILTFLAFFVFKVLRRFFLDKEEKLFKISTIGFIASFTDTIGIGSFAVTVAGLNIIKSVRNVKKLPGTLNVGLMIPNLLAATLFVSAIQVDLVTLITLVVAAMLGSFSAAKLVNKVNKKFVALFVAICLAVAGILMILTQFGLFATQGTKGLVGWKLAVGIISFFVIGGLQSFGVGLYAPALALVSLLGMETIVAFPIMTCASGFAMPVTAWTFHRDNNYSPKVAFGLMFGGIFGVVSAFFIIFVGIQGGFHINMNDFTYYLKWFAIAVIYYASLMLLKSYLNIRKAPPPFEKINKEYLIKSESDLTARFEQKIDRLTSFETFSQSTFNKKISNNNINLIKWK